MSVFAFGPGSWDQRTDRYTLDGRMWVLNRQIIKGEHAMERLKDQLDL